MPHAWQHLSHVNKHPRDEHIAFVEKTHKYYVNGSLVATSTGRTSLLRTTSTTSTIYGTNWMVGRAYWTEVDYKNFSGNIGFSRLYSRALSSTEILQNYNALKTRYGL